MMKNLTILTITFLMICCLNSCEEANTINYPVKTDYGFNILNDSIQKIIQYNPANPDIASPEYSLSATLSKKSDLKVVLTAIDNGCVIYPGHGCTFWTVMDQYPMEPVNWDATEYEDKGQGECEIPSGHTQTFTANSSSTCNLRLMFAPTRGSDCQIKVDIYENGDQNPSITKILDLGF